MKNSHPSGGSKIFPRGGAPTPKSAIIFQFFWRKLHENERFRTPGGAASLTPPGSANASYYWLVPTPASPTPEGNSRIRHWREYLPIEQVLMFAATFYTTWKERQVKGKEYF